MSDLRLIVDHLRLKYNGPFDANALYKVVTAFIKEKGFDFWPHKEFEHETESGKHIEWQLRPWKWINDTTRHHIKIRILISHYKKIDAVVDKKKVMIGNGKVIIYLDGYLELDHMNVWEKTPMLQFIRTLYVNFIYKVYTERFEQRLTHDVNHLYHDLEKFFNMYSHYRVVSKVPPFVSTH